MNKDQLIKLIEQLLEEREKNVLVVITGGSHYQKELYDLLTSYPQVIYKYLMTPTAKSMEALQIWRQIGIEVSGFEEMQAAVNHADCLIIPALSKNSLAKMACGIADNTALNAVSLAFMKCKQVIALDTCWNPETEGCVLQGKNRNEEYNKLLYSYRDRLSMFGMTSASPWNIRKTLDLILNPGLEREERKEPVQGPSLSGIITKQDVHGKVRLSVARDAQFTDMAKEYISEKGIGINYD